MKLYISEQSLKESIDYFRKKTYKSPADQLGLFFLFKMLNFNDQRYSKLSKAKELTNEEKKLLYNAFWKLAGLFDESEDPGARNCLFPFSITEEIGKNEFFNPATKFKSLLSRLRDTIDNSIVDKYLKRDEANSDYFKFERDYLNQIKYDFLNGKKISLTHLVSWYFRFYEFNCSDEWYHSNIHNQKLTNVAIKQFKEELNLTDMEESELFYNDNTTITFSQNRMSGKQLRDLLTFEQNYEPEINKGVIDFMEIDQVIDINTVERLSEISGNNISEKELLEILLETKQVILQGVPGTGKSYITNILRDKFDEYMVIQFHPSTSYEQFIGGYTIDENQNFVSKAGTFLSFCEKAKESDGKFLFVIDEINRGNISKIFGETIITLDRNYEVDLLTPIEYYGIDKQKRMITKFSIPENVYIIGTMNTSDRSIALLDFAIRRRFTFIKFFPNYEYIDYISDNSKLSGLSVPALFKELNKRIFETLKDENLLLGHSYFTPRWANWKDEKIIWEVKHVRRLINYYIIPILEEYTFGNKMYLQKIVGSNLLNLHQQDEKFLDVIKEEFPNCVVEE